MSTTNIRLPAVAGMFYPGDREPLRMEVAGYLKEAKAMALSPAPKAIIGPHAGYIYSGPIAGSAYASLGQSAQVVRRVILLGPSHRVGFDGMATSSASAFQTPLGEVFIDRKTTELAESFSGVRSFDRAHRDEHGLEVHLPFLQLTLDDFTIVPIVVGNTRPADIAAMLEGCWGGPETLIVISSDLSHYLPYQEAMTIDHVTSEAIKRLAPDELSFDHACGCLPIQGLLLAAQNHNLKAHILDVRNSGDTAGDRSRVVGYGAYAFN